MANQLGEFLRARRARLSPADVGLPSGLGPRRTPGLRREELAALTTEVLYLEDGQRMTIYQARPGTRDHDAMALLSMVAEAPDLSR
jgi:hypothetical protein